MNIKTFLKELDVSKWSAAWAFITKGWAGIAKLVCTAFTKLLKKATPDKLKFYSELAGKCALFVRGIVETFITDALVKDAAMKTADAFYALATHIADGEYTPEELDDDVDNIEAFVDAWEKAAGREDDK